MKVILFNGPPGAGKDEAARFIKELDPRYNLVSFKQALFDATVDHFKVDRDWFMNDYDNRELKEVPMEELQGYSRRGALIHVSEDILKPKYGKECLGAIAAKGMHKSKRYVFSDFGFYDEVAPVINKFGVDEICVVQIFREGCTFDNDSRRYIGKTFDRSIFCQTKNKSLLEHQMVDDERPIYRVRLHNNGTLDEFYTALDIVYSEVVDR